MGIITTAFVKQFGSNVEQLVQQKGSRIRGACRIESGITGEEAYFDQLGATAAVQKTTRNADTPLIKSDHQRRRVSMYDYEWADLIDKEDRLKMLIDPESSYATSAAWAMGRAIDDSLIASLSGTAYTGKAGGTAVPLGAGQKIVVGAAGLTIAKLIEAKEILDLADCDPDEPRYIAVSPKQISDLLATTEVTSADYNMVRALVQGKVNSYMGFEFIISNRLAVDGSNDRLCPVWVKSGLLLGIAADIKSEIDRRSDKSYATQVYLCMGIGSTRMEEDKIVEIACNE